MTSFSSEGGKKLRLKDGGTQSGDGRNKKSLLRQIWMILDYICGKRLAAIMPEVIRRLEYFGELKIEPEVRAKLWRISAASIDRLLRNESRKHELRGRGGTKPGTPVEEADSAAHF